MTVDKSESSAPTETNKNLPNIGITMGDPAGVGPEVICRALSDGEIFQICAPIIIGDCNTLNGTAKTIGLDIEFVKLDSDESDYRESKTISVFDLGNLREEFEIGTESATSGRAAAEYIEAAVGLWEKGTIDAITTAPINKKALSMGGYDYPGHTEFLAKLTETEDFAMSFFAEKLCVVLLSTHVSLKDAIVLVTREKLAELIRFTHEKLSVLLKKEVKIAVAGLNPHASEDGMFGNEEAEEIAPAIKECREEFGIDVSGPFSPDTIFVRGFNGEFDGVVSCYHDQATIAVKCLSFGSSVNVTLGLPLIRTSVDHGTAYDIAGKNMADGSSLRSAIKLAANLVRIRKKS